ncbi:MAG: septum formation initiator family protein [Rhodospirillales bacterium]|nr:MAG: septum formation initiator family protein [Rhodospirillales bacterium]
MGLVAALKRFLRYLAGPAIGLLLIAFFAYHVVHGDRGLAAWEEMERQYAEAVAERDRLHAERQILEHRVRLLRPESLDADLLEEMARRTLGLGHPDDLVIFPEDEAGQPRP